MLRISFFASLIFIYVLLCTHLVFAQQDDARKVITELSSEKYFGRGYLKHGDKKAAHFLQKRFSKLGLKPVDDKWFQHFTHPVNRFPKNVSLTTDTKSWIPGKEFLIHHQSPSANGTWPIAWADSAEIISSLNNDFDSCYVITRQVFSKLQKEITSLLFKRKKGVLVILEPHKLTWSVGTSVFNIPVIEVYDSLFSRQTKSITVHADAEFNAQYNSRNVIGVITGNKIPDSLIVITAHYDHLGGMGNKTFFPGANDNASGVAMLLSLAEYFTKQENRQPYSILFIAFAGEEAGLQGSKYYTEHPLLPLSKIRFLINLDLLGTGDEGIMVVNATEFERDFSILQSINDTAKYVSNVGKRGKAKNSDHYYFSEKGVPAFFIYTLGGVTWYHDVMDKSETLPLTKYNNVFQLLKSFIIALQ
ncbi:MAG TPA: M28 family peptidase [Bacteroidia bacterium]|nr:M28 family peptidase [Bacteroidia bacterium]HRS07296.1 M28 family peptidase [Bacteroidia bacterium]